MLGYAIETDSLVQVRQAAANSLRRMGAGARRALPALRRFANTRPPVNLNPTKDEAAVEMMDTDLRKVVDELIRKLS